MWLPWLKHINILLLIEKGANVNEKTNFSTPLIEACRNGHEAIIKFLIEKRVIVNEKTKFSAPLIEACRNGHETIVKYLIENGADINEKVNVDETAVIAACRYEYENIVKYLIEHGANADVTANNEILLSIVRKRKSKSLEEYLNNHLNKIKTRK